MKLQQMTDGRVDVYKWLKIGQSSSLILMGILFVIIGVLDTAGDAASLILSISLGVIGVLYGVMEIISGYLVLHSPFSKDVIIGEVVLSFAVVLFIKQNVINEFLSYFFIIFFIIFSIMLILYGLDHLIGKHVDHSLVRAVVSFVCAGILLVGAVIFLIFYLQNKNNIEKILLVIVGVLLAVFGVVSMVFALKKTSDTKKALKEEAKKEEPSKQDKKDSKSASKQTSKESVVPTEEYYEGTYTQKPESDGTLPPESHSDVTIKK